MTDDELYHVPPYRPSVSRLHPRPRIVRPELPEVPDEDTPAMRVILIVMIGCVAGLICFGLLVYHLLK